MRDYNKLNKPKTVPKIASETILLTKISKLEKHISDAKIILYDLHVFIKLGALASESGIIDEDLQIDKDKDDYYILLRTLNRKLIKAIKVLQID
jgi:hypothetical protein